MKTLDELLKASRDPSQPLLTYYDMSTGERVELSTTTTANWVAKTSNFLVDDLDAEPGTRIRIGLPTHWLTAVWILAAWNVAATVTDDSADIGLSGPDLVADEEHRVAASLRPFGGHFVESPAGFLDLGIEVPGHGDYFAQLDPPTPASAALDFGGQTLTHADVLGRAQPSSERLIVGSGSLTRDASLLVNACLGNGSLVFVTSATPEEIVRVAEQEGGKIL